MRVPGEARDRPLPSFTRPTKDGLAPHVRIYLLGVEDDPLLVAMRARRIEPVDVLTWQAVVQHIEFRAARCWIEVAELAELTCMTPPQVEASLTRLLAAELLAVHRDAEHPAWWFFVVSPSQVGSGRLDAQRKAWAQWQEALALQLPVPRPGERAPSRRAWRALVERTRAGLAEQGTGRIRAAMEAALAEAEREQLEAAARAAEAGQVSAATERERELVLVGAGGGASGSAQVVAPAAAAGPARPRARRAGGGSAAGGGAPRRRQPSTLPSMAGQGRVVDLKHTPAQQEAERQRQQQLDEARRARAAAKAAAA